MKNVILAFLIGMYTLTNPATTIADEIDTKKIETVEKKAEIPKHDEITDEKQDLDKLDELEKKELAKKQKWTPGCEATLDILAGAYYVANDLNIFLNLMSSKYKTGGIDLIVRDLQEIDYKGNVNNVLVGRIEIFDLYGLRLEAEGQHGYVAGKSYNALRPGLVYNAGFGPFNMLIQIGSNFNAEWENFLILGLDFEKVVFGTEWVFTGHSFEKPKLDQSLSYTRVGYKATEWLEVNAGLNTTHINTSGNNYAHGFNPGIGLKMKWK